MPSLLRLWHLYSSKSGWLDAWDDGLVVNLLFCQSAVILRFLLAICLRSWGDVIIFAIGTLLL